MTRDPSNLKSDFGQGADFGHRDYTEARKAGFTNDQIVKHLDDNPSLLIDKNVKGGGGLYDEITGWRGEGRTSRRRDQVNTEYGWQGNDNTYNKDAAYGDLRSTGPFKDSPHVAEAKERVETRKSTYQDFDPGEHPFYNYDKTHRHSKGPNKNNTATQTNKGDNQPTFYNKQSDDNENASNSFLSNSILDLQGRNN